MAITIPENRVLTLVAKDGGGFQSEGLASDGPTAPDYTPLVAEDFESGTVGQTYSDGSWKAGYSVIDNTQALVGSKSLKIIAETYDGVTCGGSQDSYFGGRQTFPVKVTPGYTIWYRIKVFFPTAFSWGYVYQNNNGSDESAASGCGLSGDSDGTGSLKFMRLSESSSGGRNYLLLPLHRRDKSLPGESETMVLASEAEATNAVLESSSARINPGTWQTMQFAATVSHTGDGKLQAWSGEEFLGEMTGIDTCTSAQGGLDEWSLGTHWNGGHYSDTGAANHKAFYVDEVVVATDMPGYGAPNTLDSGGRPFIHPDIAVGDFA